MKKILYNLYALIFNFSALFLKVRKNRVAFISMHNENFKDSLGCVYEYLKKEGGYEFLLITREDLSVKRPFAVLRFFFVKAPLLASSEYVFLNDNFMPMGKLNFKKETVITQLWHGEGAFKKIGFDIPQSEDVRKREIACNKKMTWLICSAEKLVPLYSRAFGIAEEKILPLGSPRTDFIMNKDNARFSREKLERRYPCLSGKKMILYAPTFRDDPERDRQLLDGFDAQKILERFGGEYELFIRLHPQIHTSGKSFQGVTDVTDYEDVRELLLSADVLITDYSSICMDFSLLEKKSVFYCPDLEWYTGRRDFYINYETDLPGRVARNIEQLCDAVEAPFDAEKNRRFRDYNFDFLDTDNSKRVVEAVMKK